MRPQRPGLRAAPAELSDAEWAVIAPVLATIKTRGVKRKDDRRIVGGILWRLRSQRSWASVPAHYGSGLRCHRRFTMWRNSGTWSRIVEAIAAAYGSEVELIDAKATLVPQIRRNLGPDFVGWIERIEHSQAA